MTELPCLDRGFSSRPMDEEDRGVYERVVQVVGDTPHRAVSHAAAETSEQSAAIRGSRLSQGAKALILRSKGEYLMVVMPADRSLDPKVLRKVLALKSLSFASESEVWERFRLRKGAVPPFGSSVLGIKTYCDQALRENEEIVFNAGLRTESIFLSLAHYERLEKPEWIACTSSG